MDWMLLIYFMMANQPSAPSTVLPMESHAVCLQAAEEVKSQFASHLAARRFQEETARWERFRKRSGVEPPTAAEISRLFNEPAYKKTFNRKYGAGASDRYITVPSSPEAEDMRQGVKTIFTVCLPNRDGSAK